MTDHAFYLDAEAPIAPRDSASRPRLSEGRRGLFNRRLKDRRAGGRINHEAPRQSRMKVAAGWACSASVAVFCLILIAGETLYEAPLFLPLAVAGALVALSAVALMIGAIEQRLIEIRLELMMANGGARRSDRGDFDRRADDRPAPYAGPDRRG